MGKDWLGYIFCVTWEKIIYGYNFLLSVQVELESINPCLIRFLCHESLLKEALSRCQRTQRRYQIAIADATLVYILKLYPPSISDYLAFLFFDLGNPLPIQLANELFPFFFADTFFVWRE